MSIIWTWRKSEIAHHGAKRCGRTDEPSQHPRSEDDDGHEGDDVLESWDFTRFGDLNFWSRLRPWGEGGKTSVSVGLGLSLPTGSTRVRNDQAELAEPTLQPGTGGTSWLFEVSAEHLEQVPNFSGKDTARFFASSFYRVNAKGKEDYRFGNQWLFHAGGFYPLSGRVKLLGQFVSRWSDTDEPGKTGELTDATGGTWMYLSPGLEVDFVRDLAVYAYLQIPLYQNVNAVQISADRNLLVGMGYGFDFWR